MKLQSWRCRRMFDSGCDGGDMINMPPEAVFRARGLSKFYQMDEVKVHALRSVDLDLYQGKFVVLLGPSGSGKSTLLNILGGLDIPTSGEVSFRDHNLVAAGERELTQFRVRLVEYLHLFSADCAPPDEGVEVDHFIPIFIA
jgi:ABC-type glutathione transport system ATPase component